MTSPDEAFGWLAEALLPEADVEEGTGFGSAPGLRSGGKMFAFLHAGRLVVKLPAERCEALVGDGSARFFENGHKRMREWVVVEDPAANDWLSLARDARDHVRGA